MLFLCRMPIPPRLAVVLSLGAGVHLALQEQTAGKVSVGLEASLRPVSATWLHGETPSLTLRLWHRGGRWLRVPACPTLLRLEVDGIPYRPNGPSRAPYVAAIRPGKTRTLAFDVDGWRPASPRSGRGPERVRLAPGAHTVRVEFSVDLPADGRSVSVRSSEATVEILPSDSESPLGRARDEESVRLRLAAAGRAPPFRIGFYPVHDPVEGSGVNFLKKDGVRLADAPILSEHDILSYDWEEHSMELTPQATARLPSPGVWGLPFVVVVGGERVYLAAFWTHGASFLPRLPICYPRSFDEIRRPQSPSSRIRIEPPPLQGTPDPRSDPRLREELSRLGKLVAE